VGVHGRIKLGFFPLPAKEAQRLKNCLFSAAGFSALDPCVGDGVAFGALTSDMPASRYKLMPPGRLSLKRLGSMSCMQIL
jgi:hypothetical protein